MPKDVIIFPSDALIQFSSSAGTGSGQILADDNNNLVISNLVGDVLLGDGESDIFIGDGTNDVDIVHEQNMIIHDDGSGKNLTIGSKTTNVFITSSTDLTIQQTGGNVGIGTSTPTTTLQIEGSVSSSGTLHVDGNISTSGSINIVQEGDIIFANHAFPNTNPSVIQWDFASDDTMMYAHQSSSDITYLVFEQRDNTSSDSNVFWFNDYRGPLYDSFPLYMNGSQLVVNYYYDRRTVFARDNTATNGPANNVDFFLLKSGSTSVSTANSLIHGDVSAGKTTLNDIVFVDGHLTASGVVSASGGFVGDGSNISNVSATVADESITLAKLAHAAGNTVMVRDAGSTGDPSFKEVTTTQILIGDGSGFTAAALSGDVTMTNGGVVTIEADSVEGTMLNTNAADTSTIELSSDTLSVLKVPNALTAGAGLNNGGGTFDGAAARTFSVDSASFAPFFSSSMNDFSTTHITASGNISASGTIVGSNLSGTNTGDITLSGTPDYITISNQVITRNTIDIGDDTNLAGGTGITLTGDTLSTTDGEIVHDNLSGFVANEHIDHSGVTMTAGAGLTGGGTIAATRTFNVDSASFAPFFSSSMNDFSTTGNISSSGDITASSFVAQTDAGDYTLGVIPGGLSGVYGSSDFTVGAVDDIFFIGGASGNIVAQVKGDEDEFLVHGNFQVLGGITASGNISASGDLYLQGNDIFNDGTKKIVFGSGLTLKNANGQVTFENTDSSIASGDTYGRFVFYNEDNGEETAHIQVVATENHTSGDNGGSKYEFKAMPNAVDTSDAGNFYTITTLDPNGTSGHLNVNGNISASGALMGVTDITASGNYHGNRRFDKTSTTDADHQGDVVFFGGTTSMDAGKIYAYGAGGSWNLSDADHNNLSGSGLLGVALGAASDINGMLLRGTVTLDHDPGAVGDVLYLSTTAGQATATAPSGDTDIARVVGYCLDASNGQIWFNPDNTFVEVSA